MGNDRNVQHQGQDKINHWVKYMPAIPYPNSLGLGIQNILDFRKVILYMY